MSKDRRTGLLTLRGEYLEDHGTHSTEPGNSALGKCTDPPPGAEREARQAMGTEEQERVRAEVFARAAEAQIEWERRARAEWESRQ